MLLFNQLAAAAGELPIKPTEDFVHAISGFKFAPTVGDFHRISAYQYDENSLDISAGYQHNEKHLTITVYVYACKLREHGPNLEKEFQLCEEGIRAKHDGVKPIEVGHTQLVQGEQTFAGKKGIYSVGNFGKTDERTISQLHLFVHGKNFIKFRITYPPVDKKIAEPAIETFLQTLSWPKSK
jgi:hypothetical protein